MNFYICNKDIKVLKIQVGKTQGIATTNVLDVYKPDLIPKPLMNGKPLQAWLEGRMILSQRKDISTLFSSIGATDLESVLCITKGISLNDTYWVKNEDSKVTWSSISPYKNPLNSMIANYSFSNTGIIDNKHITHSPDFSTDGNYPKCWKRVNGNIYMYKAGSSGVMNTENEPYSEVFASELAEYLGLNHVRYEFVNYKGKDSTRCINICSEEVGMYHISEYDSSIRTYSDLLKSCKSPEDKKTIVEMLVLDYLTLNIDRHLGNIGVLVNNDTQERISYAPIYDNNRSFLPYYVPKMDGNIEAYMNNSQGKIVTALGISFEELFRLINCRDVRDLILRAKGYKIHSNLPRVSIANEVIKSQVSRVLNK